MSSMKRLSVLQPQRLYSCRLGVQNYFKLYFNSIVNIPSTAASVPIEKSNIQQMNSIDVIDVVRILKDILVGLIGLLMNHLSTRPHGNIDASS